MKARLIGPDATAWAEVLAQARHDVYHLPGYVAAAAHAEQGEGVALLVEDQSQRLLLPLVVRQITNGLRDAISPYGYSGPLVAGEADRGFAPRAMAVGASYLGSIGIVSLLVRLHPLLTIAGLEDAGEVVTNGRVVVIDLSLSDEELWRQTRDNHRRGINRSIRLGHDFSFETSDEAYGDFIELYRETMARLSATDYYLFDDEYFEMLRRDLAPVLRLATIRIDDTLAAAGLFTAEDGIIQLHLAGRSEASADLSPTKLMYHNVRSWGRQRGDRWLCLGGGFGGEDDSLMHFKRGFSPQTRPYEQLRVVLDREAYRELTPALVEAGERGVDERYFPAYRAVSLDHSR